MGIIKSDRGHILLHVMPYLFGVVLFFAAAIPRYQVLVNEGYGILAALGLAALAGGLTVGIIIIVLLVLGFIHEKWTDLLQQRKEAIAETRPSGRGGYGQQQGTVQVDGSDAVLSAGTPHYRVEQDWHDSLSLVGTALLFFGVLLAFGMQQGGFGYCPWAIPAFGLVLLLWYMYLRKVPVCIVFPDGIKVRTGLLRKFVLVRLSEIVAVTRLSFGRLRVAVKAENGTTRDITIRNSDMGWYCEENNIRID